MQGRILIIDDEPEILKLISNIISKRSNYRVFTTNNSLEVPNILVKESFHVILSDLRMPGINGLDILRLLREEKREEELIIITAFGDLESAREAYSLGAFDYITKPFRKEEIINSVRLAIQKIQKADDFKILSNIFEQIPYKEAEARFRKEYIRRLAVENYSDENKIAEITGLEINVIQALLNKIIQ